MHTPLRPFLSSLLLLAPAVLAYPGHPVPEFKLHHVLFNSSYRFSTPAHYLTGKGIVSFDLINSAVPYTTHCSASSLRQFQYFYGDVVYSCDPVPNVVGSTNFTFTSSGAMVVNQTWTSGEERHHHGNHSYVQTFLGYGTGQAALTCETERYVNPNWTLGHIYSANSVTCKPVDLAIQPMIIKV